MGPKKAKAKTKEEVKVEESEYDTMDLEMLREVVPMLRQQLEKSMLDRNYVQLEKDAIQQYFDTTKREVKELELAISAKEREMELLEDNHRVELRVYQQKVKHLEYEHRNSIQNIIQEGTGLLENEQEVHESRERELLRIKEQLKFEQMSLALNNAQKVADIKLQHDKQLAKLRQQFDEGLTELTSRCEKRLQTLEQELELRRKVEIHEVEERKNQHINDLIGNHDKAYRQMKQYYNTVTKQSLKSIKELQKKREELAMQEITNKRELQKLQQERDVIAEPLREVETEIAKLKNDLKERGKDQMALRNANSRLTVITRTSCTIRQKLQQLEDDYLKVERERDTLYNGFEEAIQRVRAQTEFQNQALEQRLVAAEGNVNKAALQVEEIIQAANLDPNEVARMMSSLNQMLAAKEELLRDLKFNAIQMQKSFNDSYQTFTAKMKELGISQQAIDSMGFQLETLPTGATTAPVPALVARV
jgi:chromosome segregation ATPase